MSFTQGGFDFDVQVETEALDVVTHVIFKILERQGKTKFQQSLGSAGVIGATVDVELTDLKIPRIRTLAINDRFHPGNTLATFEVDATLGFVVTLFGTTFPVQETLDVDLKDLQVAILTTPGGLPVGISLGFADFDIDVTGLTFLKALGGALNVVADFIALGIRTALAPLGLVPIPILQFADAFVKLGLSFDGKSGSPYLGTNQSGSGLFVATDFIAANKTTPGVIAQVGDILPAGSPLNIGAVGADRVFNQVIGTQLLAGQFTSQIPTAGVNLMVNSISVRFADPAPGYTAHVGVDASASGQIKVKKGGFLGALFGGSKKVTMFVTGSVDVDAAIQPSPNTNLEAIVGQFSASIQAQVTVQSVLVGVLTVVLGPFILIFLILLSQLFNFVIDFFLPLSFAFSTSQGQPPQFGVTINQLSLQLGLGAGLTSATLFADIQTGGRVWFELDQLLQHQIQASNVPIGVDFGSDALATRPQELFLGARLKKI